MRSCRLCDLGLRPCSLCAYLIRAGLIVPVLLMLVASTSTARAESPFRALRAQLAQRDDRAFAAMAGAYIGAAAFDGWQTVHAYDTGCGSEGNPTIAPTVERWGIVPAMSLKVGIQLAEVAAAAWAYRRWPEHRRPLRLILGAMAGTQVGVVAWNAHVLGACR